MKRGLKSSQKPRSQRKSSLFAFRIGCKCISLGSPTKTFNLAGLHCSYAIITDLELRKAYKDLAEPQFLHHGSVFGYLALEKAYDSVHWMHAVRLYVQENLWTLREQLKSIKGIEMAPRTYWKWLRNEVKCIEMD